MTQTYDVIVGGAGPVGLFLACELGLAGTSVLVLERDADAISPWKSKPLGLRGLNTLSAEAFYRRGLLDQVFEPEDERPETFTKTGTFQFGGHFAGIMLNANKLELSRWKYLLPGPGLLGGPTDLTRIDRVLSDRAKSLDVTILRGREVTSLSQGQESVTVTAGGKTFRAKYLVGSDGGRSVIRKEAGFEFVGTEPEFTGYSALCDFEDPEKLKPGFQVTPMGMYIVTHWGNVHVMHFDGAQFNRSQTVTPEHFQKVLRFVSGTEVTVKKLHLVSTYTDRALQTTTYRRGRVLLAGDSAHIHSPLGAQGLNTGIGDAMNLGWKLAAVAQGHAPETLLDSYTQERHPIAARVLEWTRAQVTILRPNPFGVATAQLVRDLIDTVDGTNYFIDRIWGLSNRYDLGDKHPLVGKSAPDFEFADGTRLGAKLRNGKGLVVNFMNDPQLAQLAQNAEAKVNYTNASAKNALGLNALIVRPDGIVAWVADGEQKAVADGDPKADADDDEKSAADQKSIVAAKAAFAKWISNSSF